MNTLIAALGTGDPGNLWITLAVVLNIPAALWLKGQIDQTNRPGGTRRIA